MLTPLELQRILNLVKEDTDKVRQEILQEVEELRKRVEALEPKTRKGAKDES